jgi:hypothetical protein
MDFETKIKNTFREFCEKLEINNPEEQIPKLVTYLMTDGTRTSTNLSEKEAYMDGAKFSARFLLFSKILGCKDSYVNVFEEFHRFRGNYPNIYAALLKAVPEWREFSMKNGVKLKFVGKLDDSITPKGFKEDLRVHLRELEKLTKDNGFGAYIFINFNREWAEVNRHLFEDWPTVNAVIRFTKGLSAPESMWLPGKIRYESLIYVQQGSSSINWSDRQLIFLIALSLRAMVKNTPFYARKDYQEKDRERIRGLRERDAIFVNKDFYDKDLDEGKDAKVAMIFTEVGPERYKF